MATVANQRRSFEQSEWAATLLRTVRGESSGLGAELLCCGLTGASFAYAGVTGGVQWLFRHGLRRRCRLPVPVLSIGGLALGGTGKTPVTRWLARKLQERGYRVGLLLRGHGGRLVREGGVVSLGDGPLLSAEEAGDEALLHARSLPGVAVAVGRDRPQQARQLLASAPCDVLLLDDGFQYWRLYRDLDLVLLSAVEPFGNGRALPRGLLREPPARLRRAGAVLLTHAERAGKGVLNASLKQVRRYLAPDTLLALCRLEPSQLTRLPDGDRLELAELRGQPCYLVSALADNDQFAATVESLGARVVGHDALPDHFAHSASSLGAAASRACEAGATRVVTTEKDAVKINWTHRLPLEVLHLRVTLEDEGALLSLVYDVLRRSRS